MRAQADRHTALLFFARTPGEEVRHKKLSSDKSENSLLIKAVYRNAGKVAESSGLPLFWFDENDQEGSTFGDRLTQCITKVAGHGYSRVIVIGGDCPEITVDDITEADLALNRSGLVIGPDKRGGIYLLGLDLTSVDPRNFVKLDWQKSTLVRSICATACLYDISITRLHTKADLNDESDVIKQLATSPLLRKILSLFKEEILGASHCILSFLSIFLISHSKRRGPPEISIHNLLPDF